MLVGAPSRSKTYAYTTSRRKTLTTSRQRRVTTRARQTRNLQACSRITTIKNQEVGKDLYITAAIIGSAPDLDESGGVLAYQDACREYERAAEYYVPSLLPRFRWACPVHVQEESQKTRQVDGICFVSHLRASHPRHLIKVCSRSQAG